MRYQLLFSVLTLAFISGCASGPAQERGGLYTYVDAQGNVVTLEREPEKAQQASESLPDAELAQSAGSEAAYQTDEDVQATLEARDRNRFVVYPGADGELVTQPVDLVAEREYQASRAPGYEDVEASPGFIERILGVPAGCCAHTREQALELRAGAELLLDPAGSEQTIRLDNATPAVTLKLAADVATLRLRGFFSSAEEYVAPGVVFLNAEGVPVLLVDRPYQRRYPETWYRYAFFEGRVEVPSEAVFATIFLPYAVREGDTGVAALPAVQQTYEPPPGLDGEFTVHGVGRE